MAIVVSIQHDRPQAGGVRAVWYRYALDGGETVTLGPIHIADGADAQADAELRIARVEASARARERSSVLSGAVAGTFDPETSPVLYHTRNQIRKLLAEALINRMREADTDTERYHVIRRALPLIGKYTDAQIAALVGLTEAQVSAIRARLIAYRDAVDALDHGLPELGDG